jgi:hypothetical protein
VPGGGLPEKAIGDQVDPDLPLVVSGRMILAKVVVFDGRLRALAKTAKIFALHGFILYIYCSDFFDFDNHNSVIIRIIHIIVRAVGGQRAAGSGQRAAGSGLGGGF